MTVGTAIDLGGVQQLLFAKLHILMSDGDGHRLALDWNGASSFKPCFRHWNVIGKDEAGRLEHAPCGKYVDITEDDCSRFKLWPTADFLQMADLLAEAADTHLAGGMSTRKLLQMRKSLGFRTTRESLLVCPRLRPHIDWLSVIRYDWAHTFLAGGVLTTALWLLIRACERANIATQADIYMFLKEPWEVPRHRKYSGRKMSTIFDQHWSKSNVEHNTLKCSSSELLSLYGVMRYWTLVRLPADREELTIAIRSFLNASRCVDIILDAKYRRKHMKQASAELRQAVQEWLVSHKTEHGPDGVKPKSHWAFDVADHLADDPVVIDTFTIERLHLRVRTAAEHIKHLDGYEGSVLARVINDQARTMQEEGFAYGLVGRTAPFPGLPSARIADSLEANGVHIATGDLVSRGEEMAKVVACAAELGELFVVCDPLALVARSSPNSGVWCFTGTRCLWPVAGVCEVLVWKGLPGDRVEVVLR